MTINKDSAYGKNALLSNDTAKSAKAKKQGNDVSPGQKRKESLLNTGKGIAKGKSGKRPVELRKRSGKEEKNAFLASFPEMNPNPILELDQEGNLNYQNPVTKLAFPDLETMRVNHPFLADWVEVVKELQGNNWSETIIREIKVEREYYEQVISPVSKNRIRIYARIITERKQAEETLKASEESYRNSIDNSPLGIRIISKEGKLLYVNPAVLNIYGYDSIEDFKNTPSEKRYTPETYTEVRMREEKWRLGEPVPQHNEIDIVRKDGSIKYLQASHNKVLWGGQLCDEIVEQDITERKRAEEMLKASEQNFRNSLDNSSMGIHIVDTDMHLKYVNQAFLDIFGYDNIDELRASPPEKHYTPESYAGYLRRKEQYLRGESASDPHEVDIIRKDGAIRHLQISSREILWDGKPHRQFLHNDITELIQIEEALKASEQNFRNSLDSSPMGISISDVEDQAFYANQVFLDIFGYENIDEVRASPPREHYTPESYAGYLRRQEQYLRSESIPTVVEIDIIRKDGAIRHLQLFGKRTLWNGKQQHQVLYIDITERTEAEAALKASEQNFRNSLDSSPIGARIVDVYEQTLYANQALLDIFGYANLDEMLFSPPKEHFTAESVKSTALRKEQELRNEKISEKVEIDIISKDDTIRHLQVFPKDILWNGKKELQIYYNDITELKQAEKQLERVAQEWRTTFDSITDLISIHDKDNRILRVNKAFADRLKTTPQELVGKFCHEVMHDTKEPPAYCPNRLTIKNGKSTTIEWFNPDTEVYFNESSSPVFNEKEEVTGSIIVDRDITQQKRIEQQLIMQDRLASIGELSSGLAHELNNPLTSVIGFSQLLIEGDVPANIKDDLIIIHNEAQRAAAIVKNLLTFARKHTPVKELSQVNAVIEDVLRLRAYEHKVNNIEIEKHLATDLPETIMDHFQMQQVFLNIIVNAEFAMLKAHHKGKLIITTEKSNNIVKITFTDDGSGITEENMKRLFDPFFTTKEVGKGTGLGLSICHGIVTEHSGKIYAKSENGQGATFIVELPLNAQ